MKNTTGEFVGHFLSPSEVANLQSRRSALNIQEQRHMITSWILQETGDGLFPFTINRLQPGEQQYSWRPLTKILPQVTYLAYGITDGQLDELINACGQGYVEPLLLTDIDKRDRLLRVASVKGMGQEMTAVFYAGPHLGISSAYVPDGLWFMKNPI